MERKGSFPSDVNPFLRDVALWRAWRSGQSRVQTRAAFLHELVKLAPIAVPPIWSLAGEHMLAAPWGPFGFQDDPKPETLERIHELGVDEPEVGAVRDTVRAWTDRTCSTVAFGEVLPDNSRGLPSAGSPGSKTVYWAYGWSENHSIRDYAKVLRIGFRGIRREVEQRLAAADVADPDYPRKENFWRAALSICDAGILLGQRYAELAASMARKADTAEESARLQRMAEACARVPADGARTFFEATQALWLAHILTCGEDFINANSIGRLDQILGPYYEADAAAGRLMRDQAVELMEELACKMYLEYDVQAITLGGVDKDGGDAVNEMSYIILEATRNVEFVRDLSIRLHRSSPARFVDLASELIVRGGGIPFIFNDHCFVKALSDRGIALEDARNYAPIGCIELTIPGRANPHAVSGWFNSAKCLELALFGGVDPQSGEQLGPPTGTLADFASFDRFYDAYCQQVEFFAKRMVYHCNRGELAQREGGPLPCWSTLTDDCIDRGRDITDGGAVYNYHSVCLLGTANTADAMMALKRLLFETKRLKADELLQALRADFQGHEALRQMLLTQAPKYGNDCAEVDEIARRIDEHFIALMDAMRSPMGGRYFVHLFSFVCHLDFGKNTGATPDGRRSGEPLAYSLSAHQGRDERGITAMLNSLA
ncbi:MAG TPA: pyruvate formate lyase family protein, partial [Phycisphaerae bacterium]|nr:pyruvate formate lyase family protein [Phycisphaerae bacterium]